MSKSKDAIDVVLDLHEEVKRLQAKIARLEKVAKELNELIAESEGVAGLYQNGDVAPWDDLMCSEGNWLSALAALEVEDGSV